MSTKSKDIFRGAHDAVCSVTQSCPMLWTTAFQAALFMGFSRQEYWSGSPFSSPGDLPDPGIEPVSPAFAGGLFTTEPPRKPPRCEHTISLFHLALLRKQKPKIQQIIMLVWMVLTFIKLNFKHFLLYKMSWGSTLILHCNGSDTPVFLISGLSTCH